MSGPRGNAPTPPMAIHDVIGQELGVGDLILMTQELKKFTAMVVDIKPRLDPRSKQHEVTITLSASFPIVAPRNGRVDNMWRLQTQEQTGWKPEGEREQDVEIGGPSSIIVP